MGSGAVGAGPVVSTRRFFLVGFMAVGKTTLGRDVASRLRLPFFDLDERIEAAARASVSEVFAREGEEGFRRRETDELRRLVEETDAGIVATGGGAFTVDENRGLMARSGMSVWLDAPVEAVLSRVAGEDRPLWKGPEQARALAERRQEYYRRADLRLYLEHLDIERGAEELYRLLTPHVARTP